MPLTENFEFSPLKFAWSGNWGWTTSRSHSGSWSFMNGDIGDSGTASVTFTAPPRATTVRFWYCVSSEPTHDKFEVLIGGTVVLTASGTVDWTQSPVFNLSGATQVVFRYSKDSSVSTGDDAAFIDDLTFDFPPLPGPLSNNFNGGTSGAAITTANSGGASGNAFTNVWGSAQFTNAVARSESGLSAVNVVQGSDTHLDWLNIPPPGDVICSRLYANWDALGGGGLFALIGETGVISKSWQYAAGKVIDVYSGGSAALVLSTNQVLPVGQWVRIEYRYTIDAAGNGTVEVWTYLDPDSEQHDDYVISGQVTWPGGRPLSAEFHLTNRATGRCFLDEVAVSSTKLGPAPSPVSLRPRGPLGVSSAVQRAAIW
jgi:hypothetical protein